MDALKPVVVPFPKDEEVAAMPQPLVLAKQETYKITAPDGKQFEFPGLATAPDGSITYASLIDLLLVIAASLDNPTVDQILKANGLMHKDVNGQLYYPRPKV